MALESQAFFHKRVKELGLGDCLQPLAELGWSSMGTFAFSANYVPRAADDSQLMEEVVTPLLGSPAHPLKAAIR
eukprot:368858-Karenia_brevis.AAC.1